MLRKALLIACALLLWTGMAGAQDWIRYYPPATFTGGAINSYLIVDDFLGIAATPTGALDWSCINCTVTSGTTPVANHPGIMTITTNSTTAVAGLYTGAVNASKGFLFSDFKEATWIVAFVTAANVPISRPGLMNQVGAAPNDDSVYFEHLDTDTNWFACTMNGPAGGEVTRTDTGVAFSSGTYVNFTIKHPTATSYTFYMDGVLKATHGASDDLPAEASSSYIVFQHDATGTAAVLNVDLFAVLISTANR